MKKLLLSSVVLLMVVHTARGQAPENLVSEPDFGKKYEAIERAEKHQYSPDLIDTPVIKLKDVPEDEEEGVKRAGGPELFIDVDEDLVTKDDEIEEDSYPAQGGLK